MSCVLCIIREWDERLKILVCSCIKEVDSRGERKIVLCSEADTGKKVTIDTIVAHLCFGSVTYFLAGSCSVGPP